MKTYSKQNRIDAYRALPEKLHALYGSFDFDDAMEATITQYRLTSKLLKMLFGDTILGFYHTKDLPKLLETEVGVSAENAEKIVAELAEFLSPVLAREAATTNPKQAGLQELTDSFTGRSNKIHPAVAHASAPRENMASLLDDEPNTTVTPVTTEVTATAVENAATPTASDGEIIPINPNTEYDVRPMRTMKEDMQRVHGYGAFRSQHPHDNDDEEIINASNQDDVLRR